MTNTFTVFTGIFDLADLTKARKGNRFTNTSATGFELGKGSALLEFEGSGLTFGSGKRDLIGGTVEKLRFFDGATEQWAVTLDTPLDADEVMDALSSRAGKRGENLFDTFLPDLPTLIGPTAPLNIVTSPIGNSDIPGSPLVVGSDGDDTIDASAGGSLVFPGGGDDTVTGGVISFNFGRGLTFDIPTIVSYDLLGQSSGITANYRTGIVQDGFGGTDTLLGEYSISGSATRDRITGSADNDEMRGAGGNDILRGGDGRDSISGDGGNDKIRGDNGRDDLLGGGGNDRLNGGSGNDSIEAGAGNDRITGGTGNDSLTGGKGRDIFIFHRSGRDGDDNIDDFNASQDRIDVGGAQVTVTSDFFNTTIEYGARDGEITLFGVSLTENDITFV